VSNEVSTAVAVWSSSVLVAMSKSPTGPMYVCTQTAAVLPVSEQSTKSEKESSVSVARKVDAPTVRVTVSGPKPQSDESTPGAHPNATVVAVAS